MIHCGNKLLSHTKITSMERKVRTFTFLGLGTLANFTIFRNLLTIFDYLSLALGYILQIWLTGLPFTIFTGLANSTTLHNWLLAILASLSIPSFPFLLWMGSDSKFWWYTLSDPVNLLVCSGQNMDMIGTESICQKISPFYFKQLFYSSSRISCRVMLMSRRLVFCFTKTYVYVSQTRICYTQESCLCPAESYLLCAEFKVFIQQIQKELLGNFSQFWRSF